MAKEINETVYLQKMGKEINETVRERNNFESAKE